MNIDTGKLYEKYEDAIADLKEEQRKNEDKIIAALTSEEYNMLKGMNRAQRRAWAKHNKKCV
jgi:hypothetical protein